MCSVSNTSNNRNTFGWSNNFNIAISRRAFWSSNSERSDAAAAPVAPVAAVAAVAAVEGTACTPLGAAAVTFASVVVVVDVDVGSLLGRSFIATTKPDSQCVASRTIPDVPRPNTDPNTNGPTVLTSSGCGALGKEKRGAEETAKGEEEVEVEVEVEEQPTTR